MVTPPDDTPELLAEARAFLASFGSLQLATCNSNAEPLASYAPFCVIEANASMQAAGYGLLLSALAAHTANLQQHPMASVLFIEPESTAGNIFARRRLACQCSARVFAPDSPGRELIALALQERFGGDAEQIASLPDFHGVLLVPESVNYVAGFARAHSLPANALLSR